MIISHTTRPLLLILTLVLAMLAAACDSLLQQATPTVQPARAPGLKVVWVQDGDLWLWDGQESRLLVTGEVVRPYLAPDGSRAAFTRGPEGRPESLWTVDLEGEAMLRRIDTPALPDQVGWVDGSTLLFNTLEISTLGTIPNDDLHQVELNAGIVSPVEPGGNFTISHDRQQVMVVDAGEYGGRSGVIHRVQIGGADGPTALVNFAAIATGAHYLFYPEVQWLEDGSARVALPDPDAVYQEINGEAPPVALYALDGADVVLMGSVPASFFGLPRWSSNGSRLLYLERNRTTTGQVHLVIAGADGTDPQRYASGEIGTLGMPVWVGNDRFIYAQGGAYWLGHGEQAARRWLEIDMGALIEPVVAGEWLVYASLAEGSFEIRAAQSENPDRAPLTIAVTDSAPPALDAVLVP